MEGPGFEPRESEPCGKHCLRPNLPPLWGAVPSTQPVRWALSQHQTKVTGPAEEHGCAWREHGGEKHEGGASASYTAESRGMTSGMSHWRCGDSGAAEETGLTSAALLTPSCIRF